MTTRQTLAALLLLTSAACGDDVDHTRCALTMSLTGDITASMPEEIECGPGTDGTLFTMSFQPLENDPFTFWVWFGAVGKGQTGEFPATAQVFSPEGWTWETDACTVTITEHVYSGRPCESYIDDSECNTYAVYRISGYGVCDETAVQSNGEGALNIGSFEFVTPMLWPR